MEFFRFVIQHFCPPTPEFGGLSDKISRSKSPIFGGFRGLLGFVTAVRDFIELTLNSQIFALSDQNYCTATVTSADIPGVINDS